MKRITTLHENQVQQPLLSVPVSRPHSPLGMTAEEQKEWDEALTPDEFIKEVCRLLKDRIDKHARKV